MTQAEDPKRIVSGVELFFGESVAQYIAELSDESYYEEINAEGLLLGKSYRDEAGRYVVVSGATLDCTKCRNAVGWFKCSVGSDELVAEDLRRLNLLFPDWNPYVILSNPQKGTLAMFCVDFGVVRKVSSIMIENF